MDYPHHQSHVEEQAEEQIDDEVDEIAEEIREQEEYAMDEEDIAAFEDSENAEETVE